MASRVAAFSFLFTFYFWEENIDRLKKTLALATLKKKSVSCQAGGQNDDQSGGRDFFFILDNKYSVLKTYCKKKMEKSVKCEENVPS